MSNWKPIEDAPGYFVSRFGDIYSTKSGKILKPITNRKGRIRVNLCNSGGRRRAVEIHRLVSAAFIGPCPDGHEVCHNDGDPTNNRIENLRYGTAESNYDDRRRHGTCNTGERHGRAVLTEGEVRDILQDGRTAKVIAAEYRVAVVTINKIRTRKLWKHI